jgi:hypothetical protein
METPTDSAGPAVADAQPDLAPVEDSDRRVGEERRVMLLGFGIGITVGLIFLSYVVLGAAHLL